jgi:hypothetical protein
VSAPVAYSGACPTCGREGCVVSEKFMQATRAEPMKSLGFYGYCPSCACSFAVENPQATSLLGVTYPEQ